MRIIKLMVSILLLLVAIHLYVHGQIDFLPWNKIDFPELSSGHIPENIGRIQEQWAGARNDVLPVIIIQDSHANYEVQKNVIAFLNHLKNSNPHLNDASKNYQFKIGVEGASEELNLDFFRALPDENLRTQIMDLFMQQGKLSAPEYFAITQNQGAKLFGIEDASLYLKNKESFVALEADYSNFSTTWQKCFDAVDALIGQKMSIEEKKFLAIYKSRLSEELNLLDYVGQLHQLLREYVKEYSPGDKILLVEKWLVQEKALNYTQLEKEEQKIIDELGQRLAGDDRATLVQNAIYYQEGQWTMAEFYGYLLEWVRQQNIDTAMLSEWKKALDLIQLRGQIPEKELLNYAKELEQKVLTLVIRSDQKEIVDSYLLWLKFDQIFKIKLVRGWLQNFNYQFVELDRIWNVFRNAAIKEHITWPDLDISILKTRLENVNQYYQSALKRDQAFWNSIQGELNSDSFLVVFVGGFHTYGLTELLKQNNISYYIFSPKIPQDSQEKADQIYRDLLLKSTEFTLHQGSFIQFVAGNAKRSEEVESLFKAELAETAAFSSAALILDWKRMLDNWVKNLNPQDRKPLSTLKDWTIHGVTEIRGARYVLGTRIIDGRSIPVVMRYRHYRQTGKLLGQPLGIVGEFLVEHVDASQLVAEIDQLKAQELYKWQENLKNNLSLAEFINGIRKSKVNVVLKSVEEKLDFSNIEEFQNIDAGLSSLIRALNGLNAMKFIKNPKGIPNPKIRAAFDFFEKKFDLKSSDITVERAQYLQHLVRTVYLAKLLAREKMGDALRITRGDIENYVEAIRKSSSYSAYRPTDEKQKYIHERLALALNLSWVSHPDLADYLNILTGIQDIWSKQISPTLVPDTLSLDIPAVTVGEKVEVEVKPYAEVGPSNNVSATFDFEILKDVSSDPAQVAEAQASETRTDEGAVSQTNQQKVLPALYLRDTLQDALKVLKSISIRIELFDNQNSPSTYQDAQYAIAIYKDLQEVIIVLESIGVRLAENTVYKQQLKRFTELYEQVRDRDSLPLPERNRVTDQEPTSDIVHVGSFLRGTNGNEYQVVQKLGEGGMGEVWFALDLLTHKFVVVKTGKITGDPKLEEHLSKLLKHEAQVQSLISGEHGARYLDSGEYGSQKQFFLVQEFVKGQPFTVEHEEIMDKSLSGQTELKDLLKIVGLVKMWATAIDGFHRDGILHNDIKPDNAQYESTTGTLKILDIGIANLFEGRAMIPPPAKNMSGTPGYLSPETITGLAKDGRSDYFALGCIMFEMITGVNPYISSDGAIMPTLLKTNTLNPFELNAAKNGLAHYPNLKLSKQQLELLFLLKPFLHNAYFGNPKPGELSMQTYARNQTAGVHPADGRVGSLDAANQVLDKAFEYISQQLFGNIPYRVNQLLCSSSDGYEIYSAVTSEGKEVVIEVEAGTRNIRPLSKEHSALVTPTPIPTDQMIGRQVLEASLDTISNFIAQLYEVEGGVDTIVNFLEQLGITTEVLGLSKDQEWSREDIMESVLKLRLTQILDSFTTDSENALRQLQDFLAWHLSRHNLNTGNASIAQRRYKFFSSQINVKKDQIGVSWDKIQSLLDDGIAGNLSHPNVLNPTLINLNDEIASGVST